MGLYRMYSMDFQHRMHPYAIFLIYAINCKNLCRRNHSSSENSMMSSSKIVVLPTKAPVIFLLAGGHECVCLGYQSYEDRSPRY